MYAASIVGGQSIVTRKYGYVSLEDLDMLEDRAQDERDEFGELQYMDKNEAVRQCQLSESDIQHMIDLDMEFINGG